MPVLRWPHDHHRDLRARLNAAHPAIEPDQDRHIMMPVTRALHPDTARMYRRSSTGDRHARADAGPTHRNPGVSIMRAATRSSATPTHPPASAPRTVRTSIAGADQHTSANTTSPIALHHLIPNLRGNRTRAAPLRRQQHDPRPLHVTLRRRRCPASRFKHLPLLRRQANFSCFGYHPDLESRITQEEKRVLGAKLHIDWSDEWSQPLGSIAATLVEIPCEPRRSA